MHRESAHRIILECKQKWAIAVTTGLLKRLNTEEASGVIAHELAHVRNRDTLIMTVTATFAGAISMLGNFAFMFGGNRDRNNPLGGAFVLLRSEHTFKQTRKGIQMFKSLCKDESGVILSAEIVLIGTILVLGMIVGVSALIPPQTPTMARTPLEISG